MGIRVVVIDDNPHVSWEGRVHPVNATFHRFLAGVLDVPGGPVSSIVHCVPLRNASGPPVTLPLDPRLEVVGTAPFEGIGGYLRHAPDLLRRNARILRPVIASADLVWIKVPASNAALAGWLAWRAGVPRFGYVAGSALAVARGRGLGLPARASSSRMRSAKSVMRHGLRSRGAHGWRGLDDWRKARASRYSSMQSPSSSPARRKAIASSS